MTFQDEHWTALDEPSYDRVLEIEKELASLLSGSFGVSADATHPNAVTSEEEAEQFFLTAQRGLMFAFLAQETHRHRLDDCGDDLNHATDLWQAVWEAYFNNDGQDFMNMLNQALVIHSDLWGHEEVY